MVEEYKRMKAELKQENKKNREAYLVKNQAIYSLHSISSGLEYPGNPWPRGHNNLSCRPSVTTSGRCETNFKPIDDFSISVCLLFLFT